MRAASTRFLGALVLALAGTGVALAQGNGAGTAAAGTQAGPATVVRKASSEILDALNRNKAKIGKDPQLAKKLVRQYLLPNFDFEFTCQLVLGRYWRTASPEQRKEFKDAFLHYLTATYAKGLEHYNGATVKVLPFRGDTSKQYVTVRTHVDTPDHEPMEVDYALHKTSHGWRAFDVKIAGVSYVQTYRNEFQGEVQQTGLNALIKRLQHAKAAKSLTAMKAAASGG